MILSNPSLQQLSDNELRKYNQSTDSYWRTNAKAAREYAYQDRDELLVKANAVLQTAAGATILYRPRGWMSVATLDNRTSAICIGLHNQFYSSKDYATRGDIPDLPPRHPNCRSVIITVPDGVNITKFKGENVNTFLKRNPSVAKDIMGEEKYRLWKGGKAKVDKYIDIKGQRFYTNDEIRQRLGIKSSKRLTK